MFVKIFKAKFDLTRAIDLPIKAKSHYYFVALTFKSGMRYSKLLRERCSGLAMQQIGLQHDNVLLLSTCDLNVSKKLFFTN